MTDSEKQIANILVVDDDDLDFTIIAREFKKAGMTNPLIRAEDGKEALEMLQDGKVQKPYIILLDLNMPCMNGFEFLEEVRKDPMLNQAIIFVLTTSGNSDDRFQAYEKNIAGYIVKKNMGDQITEIVRMLNLYWAVVGLPN